MKFTGPGIDAQLRTNMSAANSDTAGFVFVQSNYGNDSWLKLYSSRHDDVAKRPRLEMKFYAGGRP